MPEPSFADLDLAAPLVGALAELGFEAPLDVQTAAVPVLVSGADAVVSAETGSGKTFAFLLPIVQHLAGGRTRRRARPARAVVLAPTRELAAQVGRVAEPLLAACGLAGIVIAGGTQVGPQARDLADGVDLIVATPGRLQDHIERGNVEPDFIEFVAIDEADRMLDLGFLPQVRKLLAAMPRDRQTTMFSATIPPQIETLASRFMREPARIAAAVRSERPIPPGIAHRATIVRQPLKRLLLVHMLTAQELGPTLVFTSSRHRCRVLSEILAEAGVTAESLHANRTQDDRDAALAAFRAGDVRVLVATDLAERGLDLPHLEHVINFDLPTKIDTYAHRVGRTARAFGDGIALSFVAPPELPNLEKIAAKFELDVETVAIDGFDYDQRPEGRDPLVRQRTKKRDDGDESRPRRRQSPEAQKQAFWERARKRREKKKRRR